MDRRRELLVRVYIVFLLFALIAGAIAVQVVKINIVEGDKWRKKAVNNLAWRNVEAERGEILSEDGSSMVTSVTIFDIYMDLTVTSDKVFNREIDSLCYYLAIYTGAGKSASQWKSELKRGRKAGKGYHSIVKGLDYMERKRFESFPLFRRGQMGGGIIVDSKIRRVKPFGQMASRLLGLNRKNAQNVGIEASYDEYLRGQSRRELMKEIAHGVWVPLHDVEGHKAKKGYDLVTTLDADIQDVVHDELLEAMQYHDADEGTVIVMDVKTGAIKAMSNFNRLEEGRYAERQNVAVTRLYEPGSTIKLATVLALLEDGAVSPDTKVNLNGGRKKFYSETMFDSEPHGMFETDLMKAFAKSSNVGIASLADNHFNKEKEGRRKFIRYFKSFGIGDASGIDLDGEPQKFLNDPDQHATEFSLTSVPWMAHGYEMQMTPLQVLSLYNAVANNGRMMEPYVVSKVLDNGDLVKENRPKVKYDRIASITSIHQAQEMLREVVTNGTARRLNTDHYSICGKTGTSKDYGVKLDGKNPYNASFAGYFPAENPQYSIIVVLYNPRKHGFYGGSVAGPVFRSVADKIFALKVDLKSEFYKERQTNVASTNYRKPEFSIGFQEDYGNILKHSRVPVKKATNARWAILNPFQDELSIQKRKIVADIVPDVVGMGIRDAIYVLENLGLKVRFDGRGRVISQSLTPGTTISGQEIIIRLG